MLGLYQSPVDVGHQVDELNVAALGARARLCALQHDRAERARGHDGVGACVTELLEADIADAGPGLPVLVRKQQSATGPTTEGVLTVSLRLRDLAAKPRQQPPR